MKNRTSQSVKNSKVALLFFVVNFVLMFLSRRVFIEHFGENVLGLNTLGINMISFFNLVDLGISAGIAYGLYIPLAQENRTTINEIMSLQKWLSHKIAYFVFLGACILMCFFPIIFKTGLPIWYAYGLFSVLLVGTLFQYIFNYKQILLIADMKEYKVTLCVQGIKSLKIIAQILVIIYLSAGYLYWLLIELVFSVFSTITLQWIVKKEYPWLEVVTNNGKELRKKYSKIIHKTKQIFYHKISGFVLSQTSPLIIFAYSDLAAVTIYDNYMQVIAGVITFVNALFANIQAGVGNLIATNTRENVISFFGEYVAIRYWLMSLLCFLLYFQTHHLVSIWLGEKFILDQVTFFWILVYLFLMLTRVSDPFTYAYGLYKDIYAPIIEVIINLSCSLILGYYYGLSGIIAGVVISLFIIVYCWKPYFLYTQGFREDFLIYIKKISRYLLVIILSIGTVFILLQMFSFEEIPQRTYKEWILISVLLAIIYIFISGSIFYWLDADFRKAVIRGIRFIKRRGEGHFDMD